MSMPRISLSSPLRAAAAGALLALAACGIYPPSQQGAALPCPPWVEYPADHHSNADSPYLGCVNRLNLANMADDPKDLDHGKALGPADGQRETLGVNAYEQGQIKPFGDSNGPRPLFLMPGATTGGGQ